MVAALGGAVSAFDYWKTECPERTTRFDPHAAEAFNHAVEYETLEDLKESMLESSEGQLEVRVNSGCNDRGEVWGGLDVFVRISAADSAPTCCVGPDCTGADFRCEWSAAEGVPTPCMPTEE